MSDERLIIAAAELSRAAPERWDAFLAAFAEHADKLRDNCVQSPADALRNNQGRAQAGIKLLKLFSTCRRDADAITSRGK